MRIKLPLDKTKNYIFIPYKDHSLIIFEERKYEKFCSYLSGQKPVPKQILRYIQASAQFIEYNRGWNIPKKLLDYISYNGNIEILPSKDTLKYASYIIKSSN